MTGGAPLAYFNGDYVPQSDACVPVTDRGFLLGDGAFETVRVIQGRPYLLGQHLARLGDTLTALQIPYDVDSLAEACEQLPRRNQMGSALLRITVSRGSGGAGYLPPRAPAPTRVVTCQLLDSDALPLSPVSLVISRWAKIPPACLPANGKTLQGLNATLARMEAPEDGEALQLSLQGHVACVSSGNLFWRANGQLYTPSLSTGCLDGVTRRRLLELGPQPVAEVEAPLQTLMDADAVFYTNSRLLARPVASVMGHAFAKSVALALEWRQRLENDAISSSAA